MKRVVLVFIFIWCYINYPAYAEVPYSFSSGTPARAEEVNRNFIDLDNRVGAVSSEVVSNSSDITFLSNDVADNSLDITSVSDEVAGNSLDITSLSSEITANSSNLASLSNEVSGTTSDIASLDQRVEGIENRSIGVTECATSGTWWSKSHNVTYELVLSTVGQEISVNGATYRIVEIPFVEFSTGDKYKIRFPIKEISPGKISGHLSTEHSDNNTECSQFVISGQPAYGGDVTERRTVFFNNNGTSESKSNLDLYYGVSIKIGETVLSLPISVGKTETSVVVNTNDFDFTDDISTDSMIHDADLISSVDTLVDYVQITKIQ